MAFQEIHATSAEGKTLYARCYGAGNRTIVLLHGFPECGGLWREVIPALEKKFTVLVPDLPGAGNSDLPDAPLTVELMADAVNALLQAAKIDEEIVLAGHSMGGYVAVAFAEKYAAQLAGLSLVHSGAGADDEEKKATREKVIRLLEHGGKEAFIKDMVPALFAPDFREAHPEIIAGQTDRARKLPEESMISFYKAMIQRPDRTALLNSVSLPFQFHLGKEDSTVPFSKAMAQTILPDISFVEVYAGTGHMSMLEQPTHLSQNLVSFIDYCYQS